MSIYFSEKFKQLRKDSDLTQDQIADIFHVSPQSVSRWETGANYPDIELLPHIAIYFKVTLDELLGTEKILGEEKAKEYIRDIRNLLNSGKLNDAIELARKAVKEYPVNDDLQFLLFQALSTVCSDKIPESKENIEKFKDEILKIGERLGNKFAFSFIMQLSRWGMKEETKNLVYKLPAEAYDTQDLTMKFVLEGEELINDYKLRIVRFAIMLSDFISGYSNEADLDIMQKIECRKAVMLVESLPSTIVDSTWVDTVARTFQNIGIAELYCEAGDIENALNYVENAVQDSMHHIEQAHKTEEDGSNYLPRTTPRNLCWILWEDNLTKPQFDVIRNEERFTKCFELLKSNSRELK